MCSQFNFYVFADRLSGRGHSHLVYHVRDQSRIREVVMVCATQLTYVSWFFLFALAAGCSHGKSCAIAQPSSTYDVALDRRAACIIRIDHTVAIDVGVANIASAVPNESPAGDIGPEC